MNKKNPNILSTNNSLKTVFPFQDIVAEEQSQYQTNPLPYYDRADLSPAEKTAVGNYQDVHFWNQQKRDWSFQVPEDWKNKPWCYVINSCCRFQSF